MSFQNTPNTFDKYANFVASKDATFTKDSRYDNSVGFISKISDDTTQRDIIHVENDGKKLYSIGLNNRAKSDPLSSLCIFTYDDDGVVNPTPALEIKRATNETKIADLDIASVTAPTINCTDLNVTGTATINTIDVSTTDITCTDINVTGTTQSTSSSTGAIITAGGLGVAKDIRSGGDIYGTDVYFTRLIQGADDTALSDVALELESNMANGEIKRFTIGKNTNNNGDNFIFAYEYSNTEANRECRLGLFGFPAMKFQTTQTLFEGLPVQVNDDFSVTGSQTTSTSTPSVTGNVTLNSSSKYVQFIASTININVNLPDPTTNNGLMFRIYNNSGAAQTFDIKFSGTSIGPVLAVGEVAEMVSNGVEWVRITNTFTT